ncbi:MAG: MBOAT family protein [Desulfovibrionaceae bacterium]|nr:MBOAT family protein [Desulfovibrionaceae bacterium]MBF0513675.1 MBOAT family protein [Desulfovibrionaceae bacterium]
MIFSKIEFLFIFLPLFLIAHNFFPYRNCIYVLFSLFFYFVGEAWYAGIVVFSALMNYIFSLMIASSTKQFHRRLILSYSIFLNIAILFFFKYSKFIVNDVFEINGVEFLDHIYLPLGISFFTFHSISYLVDVYRGDAKADHSFVNILLYLLMFPQLIAGPILRFHTVSNQFKRRVVTARHLYFGLSLFCFGLGQKVLLADTLAEVVNPLFVRADALTSFEAWIATLSYTLQIYFDFSGYSNMAIGLGWITGFYFPKNFNFPYISKSITEFWRRWHMSLSRWFRDYLYIPLGGNRFGAFRTYLNLIVVFLLCGLWHGASWTFIAWGAYHGFFLVLERIGFARQLDKIPFFLQRCYALLVVAVGWVLFRSDNISQAGNLLHTMFFGWGDGQAEHIAQLITPEQALAFCLAVFFSSPFLIAILDRRLPLPIVGQWRKDATGLEYGLGGLMALIVFCAASAKIILGAYSPFIYFRF